MKNWETNSFDFKWDSIELSPSVYSREMEGEVVLIQLEAGEYYSLNPVASHYWRELQTKGKLSLGELLASASAEFEEEESVLRQDLLEFVEQLRSAKLIC